MAPSRNIAGMLKVLRTTAYRSGTSARVNEFRSLTGTDAAHSHRRRAPGCGGKEVWRAGEFHSKAAEFGLTVVDLPTGYWQELVQEWAAEPEPVLNPQYRLFSSAEIPCCRKFSISGSKRR